ncbi:hypothetical protein L2E82_51200 [Cichorium intybus]|nr:hypothetical protein L2E82_51200 [Cichorium intybus]
MLGSAPPPSSAFADLEMLGYQHLLLLHRLSFRFDVFTCQKKLEHYHPSLLGCGIYCLCEDYKDMEGCTVDEGR